MIHKSHEYSPNAYRKIKLGRHRYMLILIIFLYSLATLYTQVINNQLTLKENINDIGWITSYLLVLSFVVFLCRYRIDYTIYKLFFLRSPKLRVFYAHNLIVGPIILFLILYLFGVSGLLILLLMSRVGTDYSSFRNDVNILNHNYSQIEQMVYEIVHAPNIESYEEDLGYIKYNISMFNLYELALFEERAKTIELEQLINAAKKIGNN